MVDSCFRNVGTAVGSCWSTPLHNEAHRRSHLGLKYLFHHGSPSRMQGRISTCKLQISCISPRLGAAEEGVSCWESKLESRSTGPPVEGESGTAWRDRVVDEEGNIDNTEQEQTRSPCEDAAASEQWPDDMSATDQGSLQHNISSEPSWFNPTFKNFSQTMAAPGSTRTTGLDWRVMAERRPIACLSSSTSNPWPEEEGIKEGDKGEAIVENAHVSHSHSQGDVLPTQVQVREKFGSSDATCDKGPTNLHEHGGGKAMQDDKLEEEEEEVFQEDDGRTPDDYQRRADLFGKTGEQFVAQKQRDERKRDY